jgi:hypothetical protein
MLVEMGDLDLGRTVFAKVSEHLAIHWLREHKVPLQESLAGTLQALLDALTGTCQRVPHRYADHPRTKLPAEAVPELIEPSDARTGKAARSTPYTSSRFLPCAATLALNDAASRCGAQQAGRQQANDRPASHPNCPEDPSCRFAVAGTGHRIAKNTHRLQRHPLRMTSLADPGLRALPF